MPCPHSVSGVVHKVAYFQKSDLVGITGQSDAEAEGTASREWGVGLPLFTPPAASLERVCHHITRSGIIPRIQVESNVCFGPGTTLQVHMEPGDKSKTVLSDLQQTIVIK